MAREDYPNQTEVDQVGVSHCMVYVGLCPTKAGPMLPGVSPPMSPSLSYTTAYSDFLGED